MHLRPPSLPPSLRVIGVPFTEVPEQMGSSARALTSVWFILLSGEVDQREEGEAALLQKKNTSNLQFIISPGALCCHYRMTLSSNAYKQQLSCHKSGYRSYRLLIISPIGSEVAVSADF